MKKDPKKQEYAPKRHQLAEEIQQIRRSDKSSKTKRAIIARLLGEKQETETIDPSQMESRMAGGIEAIESLLQTHDRGELKIGEAVRMLDKYQKYQNVFLPNPKPEDTKMPDDGFALSYMHGIVYSESDAFKQYIETKTDVKNFLEEFYSSEHHDYETFKKIFVKYKDIFNKQGITDIGYYKDGQFPNIRLYVDREKFAKFFGKEENYDEKMIIYERRQKIENAFSDALEKLREISDIDEKLLAVKEKTNLSDDELKKYLKVDDLFMKYDVIKPALDVMAHSGLQKGNMYAQIVSLNDVTGDDVIYLPLSDAYLHDKVALNLHLESNRPYPRTAVKVYADGIRIVVDGKIGELRFPPRMEYEDYAGGHTYHYKENAVTKLVDMERTDKGIEITYLDGYETEKKQTLEIKE